MSLRVLDTGPAVAVQDLGREGFITNGLTRGGAADRLAMCEGASLLKQSQDCAVLEMVGVGGRFEALDDCVVALTGAAMRTTIDGAPALWNASHALAKGSVLEIGPTLQGTYGYLHVAGGFQTASTLGARGAHLSVGIGALVAQGDVLPIKERLLPSAGLNLSRDTRFAGGVLRVVPSAQTDLFPQTLRARFEETDFRRDPRADRQGMRLDFDGDGFLPGAGLSVVSEIIASGDVQITGDGTPFILLAESQTTGGYPRIGTVLPSDMPRAVQCPAGQSLRFTFVSLDEARSIEARARKTWASLKPTPLVRDPRDMSDLLSYSLILSLIHI